MSSHYSQALTKLDDSLRTIQAQLDCLGAALEADDNQLRHSLTDAGQHAAILRDLIRAERPDANWSDRRSLEQLIDELETSAEASLQQQRRTTLLELANELDAGRVKHRFGRRTIELEKLRLEAVQELRTEAGVSGPVKELPGPPASEWLHWACSLQDTQEASVLTNLHSNFAAADRFVVEMTERYWIPGQRVDERPAQASEPSFRPAQERAAAVRRRSAADEPFWSFAEPVPHKRQLFPWVGAASIVVLGGLFAVLSGSGVPTSSKAGPTVATAGAQTYRAVQHSDLQNDQERLAVVKGSSIQVTVREREVPLLARGSSKQDLVETETLASAASGVKVVSNEIQGDERSPDPPASSAKTPEEGVRSTPSSPESETVPSTQPAQEIDKAEVQSLMSAGKQAADNGEYDSAIVSYQKALQADPHNSDALAGLRSAQQAKLSRAE